MASAANKRASMSKRAQARTEKELQDLLRAPGNATCADCGAPNPSWASWNLGVFLCMRCASIHRKLGTHISKVKSLSMDTWSNDQVDSMKQNGNLAVNKVYNPKNKKPDMPLDADEVDSAMERFIRKKYQEKSLSDGRPEVPSRDDRQPPRSKSPDVVAQPEKPSRKSKLFGFGLRASSSAYPLSKHDKKYRNEPRVDSAFRISSEDYTSVGRSSSSRAELSDQELQIKLAQLQDMGFADNDRNIDILKRHNGDLDRSVTALVKLGPSDQSAAKTTPNPAPPADTTFPAAPAQTSSAPQSATTSNNPYEQLTGSGFGLAIGNPAAQPNTRNTNPWMVASSSQPSTGLEQSFQNMQVSQPAVSYGTGGYSSQVQYSSQVTAPPVPTIPQQYAMTGSPVSINNPFVQVPLSAHSTGSNPYGAYMQNVQNVQTMPNLANSTNPFSSAQGVSQRVSNQAFNPFGLPPSNSPPPAQSQPPAPQSQLSIYDPQPTYAQPGTQSFPSSSAQYMPQQQFSQTSGPQSPPAIPNFQYGQPQTQPFQQQFVQSPVTSPSSFNPYVQQQQSPVNLQPQTNPYFQQQQQQRSATSPQPQQNPYFQQQQQQQQPQMQPAQEQQQPFPSQFQPQQPQPEQLRPQATGLLDKKSILALYNYPQLAPSRPLDSIPEPGSEQNPSQQRMSAAPSNTVNNGSGLNYTKRSATMPASSMYSAGGTGNLNPFMNSPNMAGMQASRHTSHESMAVNNPNLQDGRHSPDAFASLSATYMR